MATLEEARAHLRNGAFTDAERVLREIVAATPQAPDALELLGASLGAQGRHGEALAILDEALRVRPRSEALLFNRALALLATGRAAEASTELEALVAARPKFAPAWTALARSRAALGDSTGAERAFRQAVAVNSAAPEGWYNLAYFLEESGRIDEAIAGYRKVLQIDPRIANAHINLGNALRSKGLVDEARAHYAEASRLAPRSLEALSNYGLALSHAGKVTEAVPVLEQALALDPGSAFLHSNLGIAYYHVYRFADAERCQRKAIELDPNLVEARINLGNAFAAQGRGDEAIACYRDAVARAPGNADALSNLGIELQERGDAKEAIENYEKALALRPDHFDALNNVGCLLQEEGRRGEAIAFYRKALALNPGLARAEYNMGLALLAERQWPEGWQRAEARFAVIPPIANSRGLALPRLAPEDLGKSGRVAVWSEQGVGDQVLYATLLPDLERQGVSFSLEIDARIIPALKRVHGWEIAPPGSSSLDRCDRQIPIGSLGALLRTKTADFDSQPARILAADPQRVAAMRESPGGSGARRVGISWRSFQPKVRGSVQRRKSALLAEFMRLSQRDDLRLIDLQYGDTAAERDAFASAGGRLERVEGLDLFNDIDGVLAAIESCDLVVTTSNATAHFAGALGKETWLIYPGGVALFHYWSTDAGGRCLWYPSVRIVTGGELRTWPEVLARVERDLA